MNRCLPQNSGVLRAVSIENRNRILFEYTLSLDLRVKRGEYADFLRAITPFGVDLLELVINQYCGIDIHRYYDLSDRSIKKWSRSKLEGSEGMGILEKNFAPFRFGPVYSSHLNCIVKEKCSDLLLKDRVQVLVEVESRLRNIAAHSIISVTPEWVKEKTGKSVDEILWTIKFLCKKTQINQREENWKSYDYMNEFIIKELEQNA